MGLVFSAYGESVMLATGLGSGNNWTLKLFSNQTTPTNASVASNFTEVSFTGYSSKTLTHSISSTTWSTPTTVSPSVSQYNAATPQSWTNTSTSSSTLYGYFVVDAINGNLIYAEAFSAAVTMSSNFTLNLTPQISLQ
jgi:hypothetical protein